MPELQTILPYRAWRASVGEGQGFPTPYDERKALFSFVVRGPVPRARWIARTMARDRPSPYVRGRRYFSPRRGAVTATLSDL